MFLVYKYVFNFTCTYMSNFTYFMSVTKSGNSPFVVGPFQKPENVINWLYKQIGSLTISFPDEKLHKRVLSHTVYREFLSKESELKIDVQFGDFTFRLVEPEAPDSVILIPDFVKEINRSVEDFDL